MSKKLSKLNAQEDKELQMDMSPMIDMVFLLLVFFIVVSTPMIVKMDPEVKPAVAYNSKDPEDKRGRIVVNVRSDGSIFPVNIEDGEITDEDDITAYVKSLRDKYKNQGIASRLHLRGDKDAVFKHSRKVIKAAADAGVNEVLFSAYNFEQ
ncbi:ExbD/TolR family protein [Rubritalea marina]|uniref:ExbD/TolR family protein n=1 Tax=Rubritalea marina TaxID=361055 RepID=UPI00037DA409|nr:biopolymer transporter ExbD [Rubritalea marina]